MIEHIKTIIKKSINGFSYQMQQTTIYYGNYIYMSRDRALANNIHLHNENTYFIFS